MALRVNYLGADKRLVNDLDDDRIRSILESESGILWVDIAEPNPQDREFLLDVFGFHPLAVDSAVNPAAQSVRV